MLGALYAAFPDWHYDHDEPESCDNRFAIKWRQGGTHTAELALPGFPPVPATSRNVTIPAHYFFYRIHEDTIVEIEPEPVPGGAPGGIFKQIGIELKTRKVKK